MNGAEVIYYGPLFKMGTSNFRGINMSMYYELLSIISKTHIINMSM